MYRFLSPTSCFLYGVATSPVLPSSLSDNKSLYRFPANLSYGFSQAHRGIWSTPFCIVCCVSATEMPLSLPHKPKSPHLGSPRYPFILCIQKSKIDANRCVKKYLGIFCTFTFAFSFSKPYPPTTYETRATPHSPRFRKAFYVLLHCPTLLKLHSPSTASISVGR